MSSYSDGVSGASLVSFGGTATTFSSAPSQGAILACATSSTIGVVGPGTSGQLLQSNGVAGPSYTSTPSVSSLSLTTPTCRI